MPKTRAAAFFGVRRPRRSGRASRDAPRKDRSRPAGWHPKKLCPSRGRGRGGELDSVTSRRCKKEI
jgi:hypothetical protein